MATAKRVRPKRAVKESARPEKQAANRAAKKAIAKKARFGRPGTAGKADGDEAFHAWLQGVQAAHRPIVERLDALIAEVVPDVKRAIKWSMPMYGRAGMGWFAHVASFKDHVRLGFFAGASLDPPPPLGDSQGMRRVSIKSLDDVDEKQFRSWIQQASSLKGWGKA